MDREGFAEHLRERKLPEEVIEKNLAMAEKFEDFLIERGQSGPPGPDDALTFSAALIDEKLNTLENFYALARYSHFVQNDAIYLTFLGLVDGAEVMENLHDRLGTAAGEKVRDAGG